jgi:clan AA aspartic protease
MGLVMVKIRLTNLRDLQDAKAGTLPSTAVRSLDLEALADTGAISMAIPEDIAERLGAVFIGTQSVRVADGRALTVARVAGILVEYLDRSTSADAIVLPKGATPLLGAVQLEMMDLVVVPSTGDVIANPAHPNGPILPLLRAS